MMTQDDMPSSAECDSGCVHLYYNEDSGSWQACGPAALNLVGLVPELASELKTVPDGKGYLHVLELCDDEFVRYGLAGYCRSVSDEYCLLTSYNNELTTE